MGRGLRLKDKARGHESIRKGPKVLCTLLCFDCGNIQKGFVQPDRITTFSDLDPIKSQDS